MDWFAQMLGLHPVFYFSSNTTGGGIIQSTASESAFVSIVAARERFLGNHPNVSLDNLVLYLTTQTHSLGVKTAKILRIKYRELPVTAADDFALRGETFRKAYNEDRQAGNWPFALSKFV